MASTDAKPEAVMQLVVHESSSMFHILMRGLASPGVRQQYTLIQSAGYHNTTCFVQMLIPGMLITKHRR